MAYHTSFATFRSADLASVQYEQFVHCPAGLVRFKIITKFSTFVANQKCTNAPLFIKKNNMSNENKPSIDSIKSYNKEDNILFLKDIGLVFGKANKIKLLGIKYFNPNIVGNHNPVNNYQKSISHSEKVIYAEKKQNNYQQQTYYQTKQTKPIYPTRQPRQTVIQKDTGKQYSNLNENTKKIPIHNKYWFMRYMLFSKFDQGIQLDEESFYSVCPEILSYHIAKRCNIHTVALDPFCGAGGNVIQLAKICKSVIAMDIDPNKIHMARHNAEIYGVAHKIKFIVGNFFTVYKKLRYLMPDVIVTSPPWGGPEYLATNIYSLKSLCNNNSGGGFRIFNLAKTIAPNIALHIPRTTNIHECVYLASDFGKVEIQQNIINGKLNSITAFYGDFS